MNWQTAQDIDWDFIDVSFRNFLDRLFAELPSEHPRSEFVFWIDLNGGLNFDVCQRLPGDRQIRMGDLSAFWYAEIAPLDHAFKVLVENLEKQADFEACVLLEKRLTDIVRRKANELAKTNFGSGHECEIRWRIQGESPRPQDFP